MIEAETAGAGLLLNRLQWDADGRCITLKLGGREVSISRLLRKWPESKARREHDKAVIMRGLLRSMGVPGYRTAEPAADKFGRPYVAPLDGVAPNVSFSRDLRYTWGAVSLSGALGIDASAFEEFAEPYPFHRAFSETELIRLNRCRVPEKSRLAALLWSAKEAAVKMSGYAFHFVDPKRVRAELRGNYGGNCIIEVSVDKNPGIWNGCESVRVYSFIVGSGWLSIAVMET
jgi:phosphopantetheinyl transferase